MSAFLHNFGDLLHITESKKRRSDPQKLCHPIHGQPSLCLHLIGSLCRYGVANVDGRGCCTLHYLSSLYDALLVCCDWNTVSLAVSKAKQVWIHCALVDCHDCLRTTTQVFNGSKGENADTKQLTDARVVFHADREDDLNNRFRDREQLFQREVFLCICFCASVFVYLILCICFWVANMQSILFCICSFCTLYSGIFHPYNCHS